MQNARRSLVLSTVLLLLCALGACAQQPVRSDLEFTSSSPELNAAFQWAKQQALAYVRPASSFIGPWYEAALPGRDAFCMRDVSHQVAGAAALGLSPANENMLGRFARSAAESRDWAAYWEIDGRGLASKADYRSDADFWFNLPANFDVLDAAVRSSRWTGDAAWLNDPHTRLFVTATLSSYLDAWQLRPETILKRTRIANRRQETGEFVEARGIPSYQEAGKDFTVGADLVAAEQRGLRSFAEIASGSEEQEMAKSALLTAGKLTALLESSFWQPATRHFAGALRADGSATGRGDAFVLYFDAVADPDKMRGALDSIADPAYWQTVNIEEESYLPLVLFRHGRTEMAYRILLDLADPKKPRREYPEASFTVISDLVNGAMGIEPGPLNGQYDVETLPRPRQPGQRLALRKLPMRGGTVDVEEEGDGVARLTNHGEGELRWKATFAGAQPHLISGGKNQKTRHGELPDGQVLSWAIVRVPAGATVEIRTPQAVPAAAKQTRLAGNDLDTGRAR